jgi:hypothetical protein
MSEVEQSYNQAARCFRLAEGVAVDVLAVAFRSRAISPAQVNNRLHDEAALRCNRAAAGA